MSSWIRYLALRDMFAIEFSELRKFSRPFVSKAPNCLDSAYIEQMIE